jgi:SlyX protein
MNEIKNLGERIDALEARVAYQDDTIETLNQTITAQWQTIDTLTRQVARLSERLQEAEANTQRPANEPLPHY